MIDRHLVITCRRLLAGTLYTSDGIYRQVIVAKQGPTLTIKPFDGETHSTIHLSRVALVGTPVAVDVSDIAQSDIESMGRQLAPHLVSVTDPAATILSLDTTPAIVALN